MFLFLKTRTLIELLVVFNKLQYYIMVMNPKIMKKCDSHQKTFDFKVPRVTFFLNSITK